MANGNGKNGNGKNGKKNGNGNKTTKPIKPPKQRRGNGKKKTEEKIRSITKKLEPADTKLGRKIITQPSFRTKLGNAFLTGLTFGLYKP